MTDSSPANPLAALAFISAPAVLTNASCVLLFGAGNRYARAVDRMHELARLVDGLSDLEGEEAALRVVQLQAAEDRALYIVRALSCFYGSVAAFVASTLASLLGAIAASHGNSSPVSLAFVAGLAAGSIGVLSMISGSLLLVMETRASFAVLRKEKSFVSRRLKCRGLTLKSGRTELGTQKPQPH